MHHAPSPLSARDSHFRQLMAGGLNDPNTLPLAEIIASWQNGIGVLPDWLGLTQDAFVELHRTYFGPATSLRFSAPAGRLDPRLDELRGDLVRLLMANRRDDTAPSEWVALIIATACQGSNHLWEDLGVWNRASLSTLLEHNFPALAARNTRDMKWKKFLFKQLCEQEGVYVCRAPSCEECCDFDDCFGPE